jgi:hypothetical protein
VQPRKAPVPPSAPAPEDDPDDDEPEDEPEEPPDEDVDPELDDEPGFDPEDELDPDDEPDDAPELELPPPWSAPFPASPAVLEQATNAKAAASIGTPRNHRATIRASVGGRSPLSTKRALRSAGEIDAIRPASGEIPSLTVPRAYATHGTPKHLHVTQEPSLFRFDERVSGHF